MRQEPTTQGCMVAQMPIPVGATVVVLGNWPIALFAMMDLHGTARGFTTFMPRLSSTLSRSGLLGHCFNKHQTSEWSSKGLLDVSSTLSIRCDLRSPIQRSRCPSSCAFAEAPGALLKGISWMTRGQKQSSKESWCLGQLRGFSSVLPSGLPSCTEGSSLYFPTAKDI